MTEEDQRHKAETPPQAAIETPANVSTDKPGDTATTDAIAALEDADAEQQAADKGPTRLRDAIPDTGPKDPAPGPRPRIRGNEPLPIDGKWFAPERRGAPRRPAMKIPDEHDVVFEGRIIGRHASASERANILDQYAKRGGPVATKT